MVREAFASGRELTIGDLANELKRGIAQLGPVVKALASQRELVSEMRGGNKTYYRRAKPGDTFTAPVVREVAVPTFDAAAFAQRLEQLLATGASYDLRELVRNMRSTWPQADEASVSATLDGLMEAGKVERIALGSMARWRRCATPATETLA